MAVLDVTVKFCAIAGFLLGVLNFRKEWKRARIEAKQHHVMARYEKSRTDTGQTARELFIVNTGSRTVSDLDVDLFRQDNCKEPVAHMNYPSLEHGKLSVDKAPISLSPLKYKSVHFGYTDAQNVRHEYDQNTIEVPR